MSGDNPLFTAAAKALEPLKAKADQALRYEDHLSALEQYISAARSEAVVNAVLPHLLALMSKLATATSQHANVAAAVVASAAVLLDPACEAAEAPLDRLGASADVSWVVPLCSARLCLDKAAASDPEVATLLTACNFSVLGKAIGNATLATSSLRLWPQAVACAVAASLFCADLAEKSTARCAVALAQMGFTEHFGSVDAAVCRDQLEPIVRQLRDGQYDWPALARGGDVVPLAEHRSPSIEVRETADAGFGLFAGVDMPAGTLVYCEYPSIFFAIDESKKETAMQRRVARLAALRCGESVLAPATVLFTGTGGDGDLLEARDAQVIADAVVDTVPTARKCFLRRPLRFVDMTEKTFTWATNPAAVNGAIAKNAYTAEYIVETRRGDWAAAGLYVTSALVNHSAAPNLARMAYGSFMAVRTTIDVAAGTELTLSYVPCVRYLELDEPVREPWGIATPGRPLAALHRLRELDEKLGATAAKLIAAVEAEPLLKEVDAPARRAFTTNAGLFAMMAKQVGHISFKRLLLQLRLEAPDVWVLEHCCRTLELRRSQYPPEMVQQLEAALEPRLAMVFGHTSIKIIGTAARY